MWRADGGLCPSNPLLDMTVKTPHSHIQQGVGRAQPSTNMTSMELLRITDCVTVKLEFHTHISYRIENVKTMEFFCIGDQLINNALGEENVAILKKEFDRQERVQKPNTSLHWDILVEKLKIPPRDLRITWRCNKCNTFDCNCKK